MISKEEKFTRKAVLPKLLYEIEFIFHGMEKPFEFYLSYGTKKWNKSPVKDLANFFDLENKLVSL